MEKLQQKGLARSIGISNFQGQLIMDLLRYATIKPATLQIEHHPYLTQPGLINYAQAQSITITAYSSFGPQSFRELNMKSAHDTPLLFDHPTITKIAGKHGKTPAQVLLRWATQRGVAVIPKSNNQGRLRQNLDVTGWELGGSEVEEISGLDRGLRFNDPVNVSDVFPELIVVWVLLMMRCSMAFHCRFLCRGRRCECAEEMAVGCDLRVRIMTSAVCRFRSGFFSTARIRVISIDLSISILQKCKNYLRSQLSYICCFTYTFGR